MSPVSRRSFLGGTVAGGAAVVVGGKVVSEVAVADTSTSPAALSFHGAHQVGVVESPRAFGILAALRCVAADRAGLTAGLKALTEEARILVEGVTPVPSDPWSPPADTGVLGVGQKTSMLVTVSVGASLFDSRYGLTARRPRELVTMGRLANDRLDPARCHGDVLVYLQSDRPDGLQHGLRQLLRATREQFVLAWTLDGYNRPDPAGADPHATAHDRATDNRNLMGFKDGTANPHGADPSLMEDLVWTQPAAGEPAWTAGGAYSVVRVIRMFVEQWDRTPLREQETVMGRTKVTGAPLGKQNETDDPDYAADPHGTRIPMDSHIRRANPRTPESQGRRILRRGFSYSRGFDGAGNLDQGLAFVSYQRSLEHFLEVQKRLKGEPLEEYTSTEGGGFYFTLPGVRDGADYLGRSLLEA